MQIFLMYFLWFGWGSPENSSEMEICLCARLLEVLLRKAPMRKWERRDGKGGWTSDASTAAAQVAPQPGYSHSNSSESSQLEARDSDLSSSPVTSHWVVLFHEGSGAAPFRPGRLLDRGSADDLLRRRAWAMQWACELDHSTQHSFLRCRRNLCLPSLGPFVVSDLGI